MTCPDENMFARVQSGLLGAAELAAFHRHLDTCPECLELASLLGCMDPSDSPVQYPENPKVSAALREDSNPGVRDLPAKIHGRYRNARLAAVSVTFVCHAYSSFVLLPLLWQAFRADVAQGILGHWVLRYVWLPFTLAWGSAGLAIATAVLFASLFMTRQLGLAVRSYALLSILTGYLAPVGVCLVLAGEWEQRNR